MAESDPKLIVRRLLDDVMNTGDISGIDKLYAPRLTPVARQWVEASRRSATCTCASSRSSPKLPPENSAALLVTPCPLSVE